MTEVLLAAFIVSAVIAPLVYYFSAADRQTRFTEKLYLARIRARLEIENAIVKGESKGFEPGTFPIAISMDGMDQVPAPGTLTIEAVDPVVGLYSIQVEIPWGYGVLDKRKIEAQRLAFDPRRFIHGSVSDLTGRSKN